MYTTKEAIKILENSRLGLVLRMKDNPDVRIFKTIKDDICVGKSYQGAIKNLKEYKETYSKTLWIDTNK